MTTYYLVSSYSAMFRALEDHVLDPIELPYHPVFEKAGQDPRHDEVLTKNGLDPQLNELTELRWTQGLARLADPPGVLSQPDSTGSSFDECPSAKGFIQPWSFLI